MKILVRTVQIMDWSFQYSYYGNIFRLAELYLFKLKLNDYGKHIDGTKCIRYHNFYIPCLMFMYNN